MEISSTRAAGVTEIRSSWDRSGVPPGRFLAYAIVGTSWEFTFNLAVKLMA
jgi:hypothetical protein